MDFELAREMELLLGPNNSKFGGCKLYQIFPKNLSRLIFGYRSCKCHSPDSLVWSHL